MEDFMQVDSDTAIISPSKQCFVVDDDPVVRMLLSKHMQQLGYQPHGYDDGTLALIEYRTFWPEVVFIDVNMPIMDGMHLLEEIRAIEKAYGRSDKAHQAIILMCSGETRSSTVGHSIVAGANGYITKPFYPEQVQECLLEAMQS